MTKEMIEKAKKARSCDELMAMANAVGIELEKSKAEEIFARISRSGEISDDELDSVAGGIGMEAKRVAVLPSGELDDTQGGDCDENKIVAGVRKM